MTQAELEKIPYGDVPLWDNGPRYVETNLDRLIAEPCNTITAAVFVAIVIFFVVRMWGRFRQYPFLCLSIPVLLIGGVGGTIYHALRQYKLFFYMDVIPIVLLAGMGSIYLWIRLRPKGWQVLVLLAAAVAFAWVAGYFLFIGERHLAIIVQYLGLAALVLTPVGIVLVRTKWRHSQLIKLGLVCFGFAILFRFLDPVSAPVLPIGTHWLWHALGAGTTGLLAEYFYRIETEPLLAELAPAPSASR